jgi:PAT family beta-lactamase induction signal transducer AmpG
VYLAERRLLRMFTLCILYFAQGLPYGFVTVTLASYLSQRGLPLDEIATLIAMTSLPWAFKWVWGPFLDFLRIPSLGNRRPWIILAQVAMAATIATLLFISDFVADIRWLITIVLLHNIFASVQDVAVDALAIELLPESERGTANGFMYGSSYFGTMVGGAGLGFVASQFGLHAAISVQLGLLAGIGLVPLMFRERRGDRFLIPTWRAGDDKRTQHSVRGIAVEFIHALSYPLTWICALLALAIKIGLGVSATIGVNFFIKNYNMTAAEYSLVTGGAAVALGLGGSVIGGILADKFGATKVAIWAALALGGSWVVFGLLEPYWATSHLISIFLCAQELFAALLTVALFSLFMGVAVPRVAATQFTAFMALLNLSNTLGTYVAGRVPENGKPGLVFVSIGLYQLLPVIILVGIGLVLQNRARADVAKAGSEKTVRGI